MFKYYVVIVMISVLTWPLGTVAVFGSDQTVYQFRINQKLKPLIHDVQSFLLLPQDTVNLEVVKSKAKVSYHAHQAVSVNYNKQNQQWQINVPEQAGIYPFYLKQDEHIIKINFIMQVPAKKMVGQEINGYRIGRYPRKKIIKQVIYEPPRGFIEVTEKNINTKISPSFKLGQFLCKQSGDFPKS